MCVCVRVCDHYHFIILSCSPDSLAPVGCSYRERFDRNDQLFSRKCLAIGSSGAEGPGRGALISSHRGKKCDELV